MTLNTARKINVAAVWILNIIVMPFAVAFIILQLVKIPFGWIVEWRDKIAFRIGNKLMHMSDAVKDGTIKNSYWLRKYTACAAWNHLKQAKESGKEVEI